MAHEIEQHDGVVLHREKAWHGLGTIVENAPTPLESLQIARLDWSVEQWPIVAQRPDGGYLPIKTSVANVRSDIGHVLGIVGDGYQPIQNRDLAEFCTALAEQDDVVKIESAGSIRNGAKVWFLLKGESFSVRDRDAITPYILVSNGHDGGTALRCTPTTVRVVCSNTLHMVIPQHEGRSRAPQAACYVAHHTKNVMERVNQAKSALALYGRSLEHNRQLIDALAAKQMTGEQVRQFFLECYTRDFGALDPTSREKREQRRMQAARNAFWKMDDVFSRSIDAAGATAWNAVNAYTEWLEHSRPIRVKNYAAKQEQRLSAKLFGVDADRALATYGAAIAL
jgi:phage/plasmid-like protein (TIGR03299 family)